MKLDRTERGYALLTVMFLGLLLAIAATAASLSSYTQGKRELEEETIWRGNQYVRGIQLFYRKNGRFPKDLEDLTKFDPGQPRFLRKAYRDPMNKEDGSWRLIYMGPGGQLLGSVMHTTISGIAAQPTPGTLGGPQAAQAAQSATAPPNSGANSGAAPPPAQNPSGTNPPGGDGTLSSGDLMGGNLVGVASKVKQASIKVFQDGHTYFEWEFIWNPTAGNGNGTVIPAGAQAPGGAPNPGGRGPGGPQPPNPPGMPGIPQNPNQ
jgi:hypothetical protein